MSTELENQTNFLDLFGYNLGNRLGYDKTSGRETTYGMHRFRGEDGSSDMSAELLHKAQDTGTVIMK